MNEKFCTCVLQTVFSGMAPQKKSKKSETANEEKEEAAISHVSQTDSEGEEPVKTSKTNQAEESDDLFNQEDYMEPRRSLKKFAQKPIPTGGQKTKKRKSKDKRTVKKKLVKANPKIKQIEQLRQQLKQMQKSIDELSFPQNASEGRAEQQDLVGDVAAESDMSGSETNDVNSDSGDSSSESGDSSDSNEEYPLREHLANIAGGSDLMPSNIPLHAFVDLKTKKKIWDLKFIDFSKLLDKEDRPKQNKVTLEFSDAKFQRVRSNEEGIQNLQ